MTSFLLEALLLDEEDEDDLEDSDDAELSDESEESVDDDESLDFELSDESEDSEDDAFEEASESVAVSVFFFEDALVAWALAWASSANATAAKGIWAHASSAHKATLATMRISFFKPRSFPIKCTC